MIRAPLDDFLQSTATVESAHPTVAAFAREHAASSRSPVERAVGLFYAVRDRIRYDPYGIDLSPRGLRASTTLSVGRGWCVAKAILLAACCRAVQIPARLGFADVRNHLSTARMREHMKTDVFYWHGYTSIFLEGRWIKATPAFNAELCAKFRILPLEFDGRSDAIFHPFDAQGNRHMEYLRFRGEFLEVPIEEVEATFRRHYPTLVRVGGEASFDEDVDREAAGHPR